MLPLALLVLLVPFSTALTLEEIWHKKWQKTKLTTTRSPLYHPGIIQHRSKEGKQTKEGKTRKESTTATTSSESFCSTEGCVRAAAELLQKMDQTVDPCQDFHQFSCGGFLKDVTVPEGHSMFSLIGSKIDIQVHGLLEEKGSSVDPKPYKMVKDFYHSCMNQPIIEGMRLQPLQKMMTELGGWPMVEGSRWHQTGTTWWQLSTKLREIGLSPNYIVDVSVASDLRDSSRRVISLDQPSLGLAREQLMQGKDHPTIRAAAKYMRDIAAMLGADQRTFREDVDKVLDFHIQLAAITQTREERRDTSSLYNPMTINEISKLNPNTPWLEYINTLLEGTRVNGEERVVVHAPSYLEQLDNLLRDTPIRVQRNYIVWRAVQAVLPYLTEGVEMISLEFTSKMTGQHQMMPRWQKCVSMTKASLPIAVGSLYVSRFFKEESKREAVDMVDGIRSQFNTLLDEIDWMDPATKRKARVKASRMTEHIGFPSELLNMGLLTHHYSRLRISPSTFLENGLNIGKFSLDTSYSKLRQRVDKNDWVSHGRPAVVNAFYSFMENSIQFPAGILQGHFFSSDRPKYLNYGAIGWVIGHEVTHGFDDVGRQFDEEGNLVDWWHPETEKRYLKRAQCMVNQYGSYSMPQVPGLTVNGVNTQGENIADNGGIKEAYRAYQEWSRKNGEEEKLPGLKYTPKQLFWISAAGNWCSKQRPQTMRLRMLTGSHSPGKVRVMATLSNMEEFAKDFQCPVGSKMNPPKSKKCKVW